MFYKSKSIQIYCLLINIYLLISLIGKSESTTCEEVIDYDKKLEVEKLIGKWHVVASTIEQITSCDLLTVNKIQSNNELIAVNFAGSEQHNLKKKALELKFEVSLNTNGENGKLHTRNNSTVLPIFKSKVLSISNTTSYMVLCTDWTSHMGAKTGGVVLSRSYNMTNESLDNLLRTVAEKHNFGKFEKIEQNENCFWNSATKDFIQPFLLLISGFVSLRRLELFF